MRGLSFQRLMDVVALPAGFLVVDLHVERQRKLARSKDGIEVAGQGPENMLAGFFASRKIASLAETQHHIEKSQMRVAVGDGVVLAANRPNLNAAERKDSGFYRSLADQFDDRAHIDVLVELARIFKREMRHVGLLQKILGRGEVGQYRPYHRDRGAGTSPGNGSETLLG